MQIFIKFYEVLKQLRINQWYKGLYVLAAVLWVTQDFQKNLILVTVGAIAFVFTSSIVYIINDIKDIKFDKRHPVKKNRPIAKGTISLVEGYSLALLLGGLVLMIMGILQNTNFSFILLSYFVGNLLYTNWIKHVAMLDILTVSLFAVLRVVAGFVLLSLPIAWYFAGLMFSVTMFAYLIQRIAELEITKDFAVTTRPSLRWYNAQSLHFILTFLLMCSAIFYFITTSIVLPELIYTDVFYFALLFITYERYVFGPVSHHGKRVDVFTYLLTNRNFVGILTLFILVLLTILVWFRG